LRLSELLLYFVRLHGQLSEEILEMLVAFASSPRGLLFLPCLSSRKGKRQCRKPLFCIRFLGRGMSELFVRRI